MVITMTEKEREEFDTLKSQVSELVAIVNNLKETVNIQNDKINDLNVRTEISSK